MFPISFSSGTNGIMLIVGRLSHHPLWQETCWNLSDLPSSVAILLSFSPARKPESSASFSYNAFFSLLILPLPSLALNGNLSSCTCPLIKKNKNTSLFSSLTIFFSPADNLHRAVAMDSQPTMSEAPGAVALNSGDLNPS